MEVDRSRFLLLVGAIATATGVTSTEPVAAGTAPPPDGPSDGQPDNPPEGLLGDSSGEAPSSARDLVADLAAEPLADQCDNDVGSPPKCDLAAPGPGKCDYLADTSHECPIIRELVDARVSEKFVACLNKKSRTPEICEFKAASKCFDAALSSACIESRFEGVCRALVARCDQRSNKHELTVENCQRLLSVTKKAQHRRLISSVKEFCTTRYGYWDLSIVAHGDP